MFSESSIYSVGSKYTRAPDYRAPDYRAPSFAPPRICFFVQREKGNIFRWRCDGGGETVECDFLIS